MDALVLCDILSQSELATHGTLKLEASVLPMSYADPLVKPIPPQNGLVFKCQFENRAAQHQKTDQNTR